MKITVMLAFVLLAFSAHAEPLAINGSAGQGFAFHHNGNCFVILPQHVHGDTTTLNLSAGSPAQAGAADVIMSFLGMDLSIAFMTGGLGDRCDIDYEDFPSNVDDVISLGGEVTLVTVSASGRIDRIRARVSSIGYEALTVALEPGFDVHQGRSGSIILAGSTPIGMLIEAPSTGEGYALRIDAIVERIDRLLGRQVEPPGDGRPNPSGQAGLQGIAAGIAGCSSISALPENNCWSLETGTAALLIDGHTLPFSIDIDLNSSAGGLVSEVRLWSADSKAGTILPKSVIVLRGAGPRERPSWLPFGNGDMSPRGELTVRHSGGIRTQAIRITILDGWGQHGPIRLDGIDIR